MSEQKITGMNQHFYRASATEFMKIPGSPIAYWVSDKARNAFQKSDKISNFAQGSVGLQTGNNDSFIRRWHEVCIDNTDFSCSKKSDVLLNNRKWVPYNKGGEYRKWYGNHDYVVNWKNDGKEIADFIPKSVIRNPKNYFKESISWSDVTSGMTAFRFFPKGFIYDVTGMSAHNDDKESLLKVLALCNSKIVSWITKSLNPTLHFQVGNYSSLPYLNHAIETIDTSYVSKIIDVIKKDWNSYERSWDFQLLPILLASTESASTLESSYTTWITQNQNTIAEMKHLEEENNRLFIDAYGLQDELTPDVPLKEITLTCNPYYRYGGDLSEQEREERLQSDTIAELISYAIGGMMGRYSLDKPGLILASQGETLQDFLAQIPSPSFAPDENAILPLTDQEWFPDDATNRFREFIRTVWGEEHLQENLDFVAESLCLHAIKSKRGESALDTIRRYLSTQFYKDHLRTYKKRPIYWLFSSGKQKAFECLVYLHRYNESTLARMRTEYVIPLSAKLNAYADKLEQDIDASTFTAETKRLEKQVATLHKQQTELAEFDEKLRHYADQRISLDLDDGVKVNYGKFGDLLAQVKDVTGEKPVVQ